MVELVGYATETVTDVVVEAGRTAFVRARSAQGGDPVRLPGPLYESENGWQRFWCKLSGRPRRIVGVG